MPVLWRQRPDAGRADAAGRRTAQPRRDLRRSDARGLRGRASAAGTATTATVARRPSAARPDGPRGRSAATTAATRWRVREATRWRVRESLPSRAVGSAASWWEVRRAGRCPECRSMRSVPESSPRPRRPTRRAGTRFMACRPGRTWSPSSHSGRTTRGSRRLRPPGGRSRSPTVQTPGSISPWCFIRSLSIAARAASHMVHRRRADASSETNARGAKQPEGATEGQPWRDRFHRLWSGIAVRRAA